MCSSQEGNFDSSRFDRRMGKTVRELRVFFENVLKSLCIAPDFKFWKFRKSLKDIRSYKHPDVESHAVIDFKQDSYRHAYIFAYSIIHSLTVYDRFADMIENTAMMERFVSLKDIKLCVFGSGPALEVVAICKLISNVLNQLHPDGRDPLQIHVKMIDVCAEWNSDVKFIISSLQNELITCNNVIMNCSFIDANLTKDFSPDVTKAFKKADFIIMNKFLSDVYQAYGKRKLFDMIDNLMELMSSKSCLFLLDYSGGGVFNKTYKKIDKIPCIYRIYGPFLHHSFKIKENTVEKFSNNLENIFPRLKCTTQSKISCSAWIKSRNSKSIKKFSSPSNPTAAAAVLRNIEAHKCKEKEPKTKIKKEMQSRQKSLEEDFFICHERQKKI